MKIQVTNVSQEGNEILGTEKKTLYYLIIGEGANKITLNIGVKSYEGIKNLLTNDVFEKPKK